MKKALPYIIGLVMIAALGIFIYYGARNKQKVFDRRITLKEAHTSSYGMAVANDLLAASFPNARFITGDREPWAMEELTMLQGKQVLFLVSRTMFADEYELTQLLRFVKEGNYVFILSRGFSDDVQSFFGFTSNYDAFEEMGLNSIKDSLQVQLLKPPFSDNSVFSYPGSGFDGWIESYNGLHTKILGQNSESQPNFIQIRAGSGSFFIHTAPLAFSNYFILHKNNSEYFRKLLSVIPPDVETIAWNEYYLRRVNPRQASQKKNILSVMMQYPPFKWGLITAMSLLALYLLMEMRRRQRMIPLHHKPVNESLDFVKTMGRLYHDRKDHGNLARKMCNYFLEHVRSRYKIPTHTLDQEFIHTLHYKSGCPEEHIGDIVGTIHFLQKHSQISEEQLSELHRKLELFYQNE